MEATRPPRTYFVFLAAALLQFGLIVGASHTRVVFAGAAIYALLLWRLERGGPIAWTLLLAGNLLALVAVLAIIGNGTGVMWGNVAVTVIPSVIMVSLLLSTPMRRHVGVAGKPPTEAPHT
jgi:hypothetical protein